MAMPPRPAENVDLFDAYFRRADLDRDGRISGQEAVAFLQASGLPKNVLAQIWTYADQNRIGSLGRAEFYNTLKLVTVAQSKKELTPDLVKAALYGPASSKIPAPQINLSAVPAQQPVAGSSPAPPQIGTNAPPVFQNPGVRGPQPLPNANVNMQIAPSPGNSVVRANQQSHAYGPVRPNQQSLGPSGAGLVGATGLSNSTRPLVGVASQPTSQGNAFTGMQAGSAPPGVAARPPKPPGPSPVMQQQIPNRSFRPPNVSGISSYSQTSWPKLTQSDIQKYTRVFVEVDTDRDGKIGGIQARDLFLSWRLPREILKQVWDLSDQDNDSMLSLKEFCIALYLMERFREGRPLPHALPNNILLDFSTIVQPTPGYNSGILKSTPGKQQQPGKPGPGAHERPPSTGPRQPLPDLASPTTLETHQQKSRVPILEKHLVDQLSKEEQDALNSKFGEATESEKKVEDLEKEITESRQKIEFYRAKMQELVLYKSRCDNHINDILERASADKREVELLSKKYEEKYKQMGVVASKLTIEEATFRDIQEKKMELYKAIVKMEQDGGDDGVTQAHADRIQQEIDELVKSLNERCKKYGLRARPASLVELPFGWQPGIQEEVADWDGDWDKFDDEGFSLVKELTLDVQNVIAPPKAKSTVTPKVVPTAEIASPPPSADNAQSEKSSSNDKEAIENGTDSKKNEDSGVESAPSSPAAVTASKSSSKESTDSHFKKSESEQASPRFDKTESEHKGGVSSHSGDNRHDEPKWGRFDASEEADSLWGFNGDTTAKETDHENHVESDAGNHNNDYFFDSGDFNLNPIKTGPSQAEWSLPKKSTFTFDESVPSTPLNGGNSPLYGQGSDYSFDKFSRFDSFNMSDSGLFQPPETPSSLGFGQREFARFDSMRSTNDFDQGRDFSRFDSMRSTNDFDHGKVLSRFDSMSSSSNFDGGRDFSNFDSVSSTGNFDNGKEFSCFDSMRSTSNYDVGQGAFSRFDSMRSTQDFNPTHGFPSLDDPDPFGSTGPFKSSFESETPRSEYNSWGVSETPRRDSNTWGVAETPRRDSDSWSVSDPFGSTGPFKTSFDAETPRRTSFDSETPRKTSFDSETPRSTNNWSAF
uniref:Uncharacterized protein n=1 Tax=Kalanchoe fedtschenkoi TaxID=63787 RepID=A0A7N0UHU6_KALFE